MNRTVISLPPDLHKRLRILAAERGVSMASVIREALEEKMVDRPRNFVSLGIGDSGRNDLSRRASDGQAEYPDWRSS